MTRPIIAVADSAFPDRLALERDFGDRAEIRWADLSSEVSTRRDTAGAAAVVVTLQRLTAEVIAAFDPTVCVIGRAGVGLDTIDLDAAAEHGVAVFNQPAYGMAEVATHALALLLSVQRRLTAADEYVRKGWHGPASLGTIRPLDEATIGVIGCGRIGRAFVQRVEPLVAEVLVYDPDVVELPEGVVLVDDLDDLLRRSELLSLHLPLSTQTRDLIGRRELAMLPTGAIVVNVSRGGIVNEDALADLLHAGHLGGAGLDVFAEEPLPSNSPLLRTPNTVLSPHCAALSDRASQRLSHWTIGDAIEFVTSRSVTHGVVVVEPPPESVAAPAVGQA